jgi:hypothetical protein
MSPHEQTVLVNKTIFTPRQYVQSYQAVRKGTSGHCISEHIETTPNCYGVSFRNKTPAIPEEQ